MRYALIFCFIMIILAVSAYAQEGYPSGYFYFYQGGDTMCVYPITVDAPVEELWYDYQSASTHTGYQEPYKSKIFFYYNPWTGNMGMAIIHNEDEVGTSDASCDMYLVGLPDGCVKAFSDDANEFDLTDWPQGHWHWWYNTDGGAFYIPRAEWGYAIDHHWGGSDPIKSWWFISALGPGSPYITEYQLSMTEGDTLFVGHGFLEMFPTAGYDEIWLDDIMIGTEIQFRVEVYNSGETGLTLEVYDAEHSNPAFTTVDIPGTLPPGGGGNFTFNFAPTEVGLNIDTVFGVTNEPCTTMPFIIYVQVRPRWVDALWFWEETECNDSNIVHICYNTNRDTSNVNIWASIDSGATWVEAGTEWFKTFRDAEGDIGEGVSPDTHCFEWILSDDTLGVELDTALIRIGLSTVEEVVMTTRDDFLAGDTFRVKILSPDPDGTDDGALWIPPGRDTIYALQVFPDGHCMDCMSNAIYNYMGQGDPPLKIKIYLMAMTQFQNMAQSFSSTLTVRHIDAAGVIHPQEFKPFSFFDIAMFGVADSYGGEVYDLTPANVDAVRTFCQAGRGLLLTHDTAGCGMGVCLPNFCSLTDISGLACGDASGRTFTHVTLVAEEAPPILDNPFTIPADFDVLTCHQKGQIVVDGWVLYRGVGGSYTPTDSMLYWQAYHNPNYNSFCSFYSYGHTESAPMEWESKAMINSIYYSFHGGIGSNVYTSEPFEFRSSGKLDVSMDVDIPDYCLFRVEVALDTCLGFTDCWTEWYPYDEIPDLTFYRVRYRIGMTLNEDGESPIVHWIRFGIAAADTFVTHGPLDSYPPRVSAFCPPDTLSPGDIVNLEWTLIDSFWSEDLCSALFNYCDRVDVKTTTGMDASWTTPEVLCDSIWVRVRVAVRDSFCNWGYDTCSIFFPGRPDLWPDNVGVAPSPPLDEGREATFFAWIHNTDIRDVVDPFKVGVLLNNRRVGSVSMSGLSMSASDSIAWKGSLEEGHYKLCFYADIDSVIVETDENNNEDCIEFDVYGSSCLVFPNPFSPGGGDVNEYAVFDYPYMYSEPAELHIFDVRNREVFHKTIGPITNVSQYLRRNWYGKSNSGELLPEGIYLYVIERQGQVVCNGTVVIAR